MSKLINKSWVSPFLWGQAETLDISPLEDVGPRDLTLPSKTSQAARDGIGTPDGGGGFGVALEGPASSGSGITSMLDVTLQPGDKDKVGLAGGPPEFPLSYVVAFPLPRPTSPSTPKESGTRLRTFAQPQHQMLAPPPVGSFCQFRQVS